MKDTNSWHLMPKEDVLRDLSTDMFRGLTMEESKRRRRKLVSGSVWHVKRTSAGEVALATVFDLATLLLMITAAAAALFDRSVEAGAIAGILLVGGLLRAVTYVRACRIFENMAKERIPVASVIREGNILLLRATEVVPGDILFLEAGDTVPCDGRVVTGEDSVVAEQGITENKSPVHKYETVLDLKTDGGDIPCEYRTNMLFAGSLVLSGSVRLAATACGNRTLVSMKQGGIEIEPAEKLELVEQLHRRSRNVSLLMLACVMVLTVLSLFVGDGFTLPDVFLGTMAMAVAAMSEFLTTIGTIILAVTVRDCASSHGRKRTSEEAGKALPEAARDRAFIRTPADIGRIAEPRILVFCGSGFFKSGRAELYAYRAQGTYLPPSETAEGDSPVLPDELLTMAAAATGASAVGVSKDGLPKFSERAGLVLRTANAYSRRSGRALDASYTMMDHRDLSHPKTCGMDISLIYENNAVRMVSCGSAEAVLACCIAEAGEKDAVLLSEERKKEILSQCAELESGGARVMAVASRPSSFSRLNRLPALTQNMTFGGFFAVTQEPEPGAEENLRALRERGMLPILFTEAPETDRFYGERLGLFDESTRIVRSLELSKVVKERVSSLTGSGMIVSFDEIGNSYLAGEYTRAMKLIREAAHSVSPALRVAAVGREPWDAGVLTSADWGVAAAKSELRPVPDSLTRRASLVLYPAPNTVEAGFGGLAGLLGAVRSSRQAICGIEAAKRYLLLSQCARLTLILAAVLFGIPLISPVFILIWGLLFDFGAVLTMAFEKPEEKLLPHETKRSLCWNVAAGVLGGAGLASLIPLAQVAAASAEAAFTEAQGRSLLSAAALWMGLTLAAELSRSGSLFRPGPINLAEISMLAATVLLSAAVLLTEAGARLIGGAVCGVLSALALLPAAAVMLAMELDKAIRKSR